MQAVLVEHSTDGLGREPEDREGGELRPKEPAVGKVKPGMTFCWEERWEIL